ncbi:helix-turn-helix transcriptional regulator [Clostridium swellfunianum]|uniref:helix-turn-helix transcriptional regulator n=1 Tax=Clostridium swellfunianum TaxID=1367462 RepID=UPI00202EC2A8|nr:helix-turn-helix transcriptional regulator [Clostridium swellfunianum]MCM0646979.1 helix-turn-helix transcriptional regulator [Clostridium swellfunianum]
MEILSLGEKLKRRRKELNMTLKDLAGDRITPGQISLVESGKSNPSMDLLEYLASTLNTSIEYLMESEETQAENICAFFENMTEACILNEDLVSADKQVEQALYYAEKYNLEYRKAKNLYLRGVIYIRRYEHSLAQKNFLAANIIFIKLNSYEDIIFTFLKLGIIALGLKAYQLAYSYFKQAEKVFKDNDVGNDFLLGEIYYYISFTYFKLENTQKAVEHAKLSREKFRQLDEKKEYAASLLDVCKRYGEKGDINNALKYSRKTLSIFRELYDNSYLAEIENNLGKLFFEFEDYEESFFHLSKSKELRERNKDSRLSETLVNICESYIKKKDVESSRRILQQILDNSSENDYKVRINYYMLRYRIEVLDNNMTEAEETLKKALSYVNSGEHKREEAEIAMQLGKFYTDKGQAKEAFKYLQRGVDIFKGLGVFKGFD